jgi:hypothetical protein
MEVLVLQVILVRRHDVQEGILGRSGDSGMEKYCKHFLVGFLPSIEKVVSKLLILRGGMQP